MFQSALMTVFGISCCYGELPAIATETKVIPPLFEAVESSYLAQISPEQKQSMVYVVSMQTLLKYVSKANALNFDVIVVSRPCIKFFSLRYRFKALPPELEFAVS